MTLPASLALAEPAESATALRPATGRNAALDVLRVAAVLGVIAIHVFAELVTNDAIRGARSWWAAVVLDLGSVWAVPVLVMVSGALLLDPRAHRPGPLAFYTRRLSRLGPAIVFWHLFYLLIVRIWMGSESIGLGRLFQLVADGEVYTHLYFLWLIVGLYVVAPVLAPFLAEGLPGRSLAFAATALVGTVVIFVFINLSAMVGSPRPIFLGLFTQWLPYVGYFAMGWALRNLVLGRRGTAIVAVVTAVLLAEIIAQYAARPEYPALQAILPVSYLGATVVMASIGVFILGNSMMAHMKLPDRQLRLLSHLSQASFGAFLTHFFFIAIMRTRLPALTEALSSSFAAALLAYACVVALSFGVSLVALRLPIVRRIF